MRLAFCLFKYFPYGGLQRDFRGIALACLSAGFEIDVYTMDWQGERIPEFNLHVIRSKGLSNHQRYQDFANQVQAAIATQDYAAVIGFNKMPGLDFYYAADPCFKLYLLRSRPFWYRFLARNLNLARMEKNVFARDHQNHIFALADDQIRDFQLQYQTPKERFSLLPPWIKPDRFYTNQSKLKRQQLRSCYQIAEDDWLIVAIGSGFRSKGVDRALQAIASLPEAMRKKVHYFILGQDKFTPVKRQIQRLGLTEHVKYFGGRDDVADFLFAADLLLHPAYRETAGIVILEAIVAGLPVLTTVTCGYAHHVERANAGIVLHDPFSQYDLNRFLVKMLNELKQQPWSENGIRYGLQHRFSQMPIIAAEIIKQYVRILRIKNLLSSYTWQIKSVALFDNKQSIFQQVKALKGDIFRELSDRKTLRFSHEGKYYFAKIHYGVGWKELIKNYLCLRSPIIGAQHEFYALRRLEQVGVNSLLVVAAGWQGKNPATQFSFLVTKALEQTESLENILAHWNIESPTIVEQYRLIREVAKLTRKMHEVGVNHRDYYSCHLFIKLKTGLAIDFEDLQIFILDLHRAQLREVVPTRWLVKDLGSLLFSVLNSCLSVKHWLCFVREYEQNSLHEIFTEKRSFWEKVVRRANILQRKAIRKKISIAGKPYEYRVLV